MYVYVCEGARHVGNADMHESRLERKLNQCAQNRTRYHRYEEAHLQHCAAIKYFVTSLIAFEDWCVTQLLK